MKTIFTFLLVAVATTAFSQTIHRVNNNPGVTGTNIYTTIQAAHDAATDGDIIYAESSGTSYGTLVCVKVLTIVGPGYYLAENFPNTPSTTAASFDQFEFNTGSSGSAVYGCDLSYIYVRVSNITVSQNTSINSIVVGASTAIGISGINITKNFGIGGMSSAGPGTYQVNVSNNYFNAYDLNLTQISSSGVFSNNVAYVDHDFFLRNFTVTNNIVYMATSNSGFTSCTLNNNISCIGSIFGTSNGNQGSVSNNSLFVNLLGSLSFQKDGDAALKAGSPAIGAGAGGTDCGIYGGLNPYVLSGIPPYPQITKLIGTSTGNATTPLSITISTKSN